MARYFKQTRPVYHSSDDADNFTYDVVKSEEGDAPLTTRPYGTIRGIHEKEQYSYNQFDDKSGSIRHPESLFKYTPATLHISEAYFDPIVRSQAVPLMARIAADYPTAPSIEASDDLSQSSSNLVNKAQKMGFPVTSHKKNPESKKTNSVQFEPMSMSVRGLRNRNNTTFEEIPKERIEESMKPVRAQVKAASIARKESKLSANQFPQTQLPGMENY